MTGGSDAKDSRGVNPEPAGSMRGISAEALMSLRVDMLRFAELQLRDSPLAEDLVQESIEAALRKSSSFNGQSTLKTWVFAILRNRIIDHLRQASRTVNMSSLVGDDEDWHEKLEALFTSRSRRPGAFPISRKAACTAPASATSTGKWRKKPPALLPPKATSPSPIVSSVYTRPASARGMP